jgi:hypothetical protein
MPRLALALVLLGCACGSKKSSTPDARPAIPDAGGPAAEEADVRPVYPVDDQPPEPLALRLCQALHELPARRKAECCGGGAAPSLVSECARTLSSALRARAITLAEPAVAACEQAMTGLHDGCEWVGPLSPGFPAECRGLVHGTLAGGARCRSSMECAQGLRCRGVGPTDPGTCGPPLPDGTRCSVTVDTLVSYTRQDAWTEEAHPECSGYCMRRACRPAVAAGKACKVSLECGAGHRCSGGACVAGGVARDGESCSADECEAGLRCLENRCRRPKAAGEPCQSAFECRGGCVEGACAQQCAMVPPTRSRPDGGHLR